jgi:NADH-quinone oxidoreductase subunit H
MMSLFNILIFPGLLFLVVFGLAAEYVDRKLHARMQNRVGPPWFQPLADLLKLLGKQDVVPEQAERGTFVLMPIIALTATAASFLYIPLWGRQSLMPFPGDLVVVLYLLTIPTFTFFLAGWYSRSLFSMLGAARAITQLFAYEIPLLLSMLAAALLADSWSLREITEFYGRHPVYAAFNVLGFVIAIVSLLGKLERVPFDIPEAETEIVAGSFTEYSGRLLALFRLCLDVELVVGCSLVAAVFLPFGLDLHPAAGFVLYVVKVLFLVGLVSLCRSVAARLRIDQMINLFWQVVAPAALVQVTVNLLLKGVVAR